MMRTCRAASWSRERGSSLILILIVIAMLLAFSAVLAIASSNGVRAIGASHRGMMAFYVADSGAQVGIARLRASEGTLPDISFVENVDRGSASVSIERTGAGLFRIRSTGTCFTESKTVELYLKFTGGFTLPAAFSVTLSQGTEMRASGFRVQAGGSSTISGKDHAANGTLLPNQDEARFGLSVNRVPRRRPFQIEADETGSGLIEGVPQATTNEAPNQDAVIKAIRDAARTGADITIFGSRALGSSDAGLYGTAGAPKLVYARLGDRQAIQLKDYFAGYGTIVIDADRIDDKAVLELSGSASWYGLVVVYARKDAEIDGKALIDLSGSSKIVGGLTLFFNSERVSITGKGPLLKTAGGAAVLYSSELLSLARGTEGMAGRGASLISYRIP